MSYNPKDIQFMWKHDYNKPTPYEECKTFSIRIFQWIPKSDGKSMKEGTGLVRIVGSKELYDKMLLKAEEVVSLLDAGLYKGKKTITIKL